MAWTEKRDSVRVKDRLQVVYRLLSPVYEYKGPPPRPEDYFPYIWTRYPSDLILEDVDESSEKILSHIIDLNRKIDIMIELLLKRRVKLEVPEARDVCISASGIRINIRESSTPGQRIALCIILPFVPPFKVFTIGEVARSVPTGLPGQTGESIYETGIKFVDLREDDHEKIIRYIFKRQRDILRDKKLLTGVNESDKNDL